MAKGNSKKERAKNHAKNLKSMNVQRTTFQNFCGHTIGVGQSSILAHFAVCKGKRRK